MIGRCGARFGVFCAKKVKSSAGKCQFAEDFYSIIIEARSNNEVDVQVGCV